MLIIIHIRVYNSGTVWVCLYLAYLMTRDERDDGIGWGFFWEEYHALLLASLVCNYLVVPLFLSLKAWICAGVSMVGMDMC